MALSNCNGAATLVLSEIIPQRRKELDTGEHGKSQSQGMTTWDTLLSNIMQPLKSIRWLYF